MKKRTPDKFWFPWWPDKWIFGSVRIECSVEERAVWVDLLSLASKDDGFIRANEETPYPLSQLSGMLIIPEKTLSDAIEKFIKLGKLIRTKEGTLCVAKWDKYQFSERHKRRVNGEMAGKEDAMTEEKDAIIKEIKLEHNNSILKEDTEILTHLSKVKNYPFNKEKDLEFIQGLKKEFPSVDILEKVKQVCINWLKFPLLKKSRPRVQIRRWVTNEKKWQKERDQVGKSTKKPTKEKDEFTKARNIQIEKICKSHEKETEKAKKDGDKDRFNEIQNQIKVKLADWSQEYYKEKS